VLIETTASPPPWTPGLAWPGVAICLAGAFAIGYAALWLQVLLHEIAHLLALRAVGGRVHAIRLGAGRHVWSRRVLGVRIELRPVWHHAAVYGAVTDARGFRWRWAAVYLAGPLASTAFAWVASRAAAARPALPLRGDWSLVLQLGGMAAWVLTALAALVAWIPKQWRAGGATMASDVLALLRVLRLRAAAIEDVVAAAREQLLRLGCWETFLAGDPAAALRQLHAGGGPPAARALRMLDEAVFVWAAAGADAALPVQDAAAAALAAHPVEDPGLQGAAEVALRTNRLFLLVQAGRPEMHEAAREVERCLGDAAGELGAAPRRTLGLFHLHAGDVPAGMQHLAAAWRTEEPVWGRALCAVYLAYGHALRGEGRRARRFLRKARRLHPQCPLLAKYSALVAAARRPEAVDSGPRRA
jgi:hypothetical protein